MERVSFYDHIAANKRNSVFLVLIVIIFMVFLGYLIGLILGSVLAGVMIAVSVSIFLTLIGVFSGDDIVLSASHAEPADKKQYANLVNTVEGLSIAAGIPMPKVYVIKDPTINAMAIGRNPKKASIAVTTGALEKLNRSELEGVIGHEMSHIKNYDVRFMMLTTILVGIVILLSDFFIRAFFYSGGDNDRKVPAVFLVFALVLAILAPIGGTLIKLAVSRKREFLADANGALLTRHPQGLANALKKIKEDGTNPSSTANKAIAHLYFSNPFKNGNLFSTHPDIDGRISRLESM
ncbi:M48 family metalloprotease [Candidatus Woesearchaeota archaeon]|nr:M48 family metalloprotease [Candidatus Woesearchaeota archaeon]